MQSMALYITKRVFYAMIVLLVLSFVVFSFIRLIPGDPVRMALGPSVPEDVVQRMRSDLNFDKPIPVQYFYWLRGVFLRGDFGQSLWTRRNVSEDIAEFLPRSIELSVAAALMILVLGVALGTFSALFRDTWVDNVVRIFSYLGVVTPPYAFAIFFMLLFAFYWRLFPVGGMPELPAELRTTGMVVFDSLIHGRFGIAADGLRHLFLPAVSLSVGSIAYQARMHRSAVIDNIGKDYISFARVVGVKGRTVIAKHLMKPSFIPSLTIFGLQVGALLGNAFLIEVMFQYPGFSRYSLNVIMTKDPYGVVAVTLVFGVIFALMNILIDLGVAWLDPRVRLRTSE
mgnify:CR=1 FL=1